MVKNKLFFVFAIVFSLTLAAHANGQAATGTCGPNVSYPGSCCGHVTVNPGVRPQSRASWWYSPDNSSP